MEKKKRAHTPIKRVRFQYTGSLEDGLNVYKASADGKRPFKLDYDLIKKTKSTMLRVCPAIMGTNWENPPKYSIGYALKETLKGEKVHPQCLSYIIPLLIEAGFCEVDIKTHEIKIIK
jgi:hypothetical protein